MRAAVAVAFLLFALPAHAENWKAAFAALTVRLDHEGRVTRALLPTLAERKTKYNRRAVEAKMLDLLRPSQSFDNYLDAKSIEKTRTFIKEHTCAFTEGEKESGVPRGIVAAVLMVETRLGNYAGKFPELSVLMSLSALSVPEFRGEVAPKIAKVAKKKFPDDPVVDWDERGKKIGEKWFEELRAFLILADLRGWKVHEMMGSWAGAMGYGQYMPTTALRMMQHKGATWLADLNNWDDTILLTARHLKENGWLPKATEAEKREAVRKYNGREAYADAVLKLTALLDRQKQE